MTKEIGIKKFKIGGKNKLFLIAGPCVIEGRDICFDIAKELKKITKRLNINFIFKASYDKANRTSIKSFRGIGIERGLSVLRKIKEELNVPVLSDIHCVSHIKKVKDIFDIIQIPAFLSRQTDLIVSSAKTGKIINVKRGQFLAPWDMKNVIEKIESVGNDKIILTERGTLFGYNNLIVDMTSLPIMRSFGYPVVFDATHSVQKPGGGGDKSSGAREFVPHLVRGAVAVGIDGLFLEVHPEPDIALSDGANMVKLLDVEHILSTVIKIDEVVCTYK